MNEKEKLSYAFFKSQKEAILSTHSKDLPGYPFGSLTQYCCLPNGKVVILISTLAQHTSNICLNSKVCLTVSDHLDHVQAGRRWSFVGDAFQEKNENEILKIKSRYLRFFPEAESYFGMHDFSFYSIDPVRIRFIGGFGQIFWIEKLDWSSAHGDWLDSENSAIEHMNQDHQEFLRMIAQHNFKKNDSTDQLKILAIDPSGFYLKKYSQENLNEQVFIPFAESVKTSEEVRQAFVQLGKIYREKQVK